MSRRGCRASSPSVAAASKPANDRKPNTTPRKSAEVPVPSGTVNGVSVSSRPPGAFPIARRTRMTAVTTRISATVTPSTVSSTRVPCRTGETVSR